MVKIGWLDDYPHVVYANVLLNENNKIVNWKVGNREWKHVFDMTWRFPMPDNIEEYTVISTCWEVYNEKEHNNIFQMVAREWFRQWEYEEDYMGFKPY